MKISFAVRIGLRGMYVELDMKFIQPTLGVDSNENSLTPKLIVQQNVPEFYITCIPIIEETIRYHYNLIRDNVIDTPILSIESIESELSHFEPNVLAGATVKWLNENLNLDIPYPEYSLTKDGKHFVCQMK